MEGTQAVVHVSSTKVSRKVPTILYCKGIRAEREGVLPPCGTMDHERVPSHRGSGHTQQGARPHGGQMARTMMRRLRRPERKSLISLSGSLSGSLRRLTCNLLILLCGGSAELRRCLPLRTL